MNEVEEFIYRYEGKTREIMLFMHEHIMQYNLQPKISFRVPFYYGKRWVCYMNPKKSGNVDFAFCRGNEMSDGGGIIDRKGRAIIASIELDDLRSIPLESLDQLLQEAILLDQTVPQSPRRPKKR